MKVIMPKVHRNWVDQVLVVDGGSTDGTVEWARAQGYEVYIQKEKGLRHAYSEVWPLITGDVVITFSPDGNSVPELIPELVAKMHEGNETFIWDEAAFNTMNYYEFVSDQYLSVFYTHHFDGLLFNHIPLLKKLHWREVAYYKGVIGSLTDKNKQYNSAFFSTGDHILKGPYQEVGVGIENIFKVLRIYGVWRLNYLDHPDIRKFMVMLTVTFYF